MSRGIQLNDATDAQLIRNKVLKSTSDAFFLGGGTGVFAERNKAIKPQGHGFIIDVDGSVFERNVATAAAAIGFEVLGLGNTFSRNRASKSGQFDLVDSTSGENTYAPDNKFTTTKLD